ncbi:MAG TPA: DUF2007 domain-containing protein [bacterium]|jgi:hypothetical protein|nr:DUF2007 domain-containing protein [bacterium]
MSTHHEEIEDLVTVARFSSGMEAQLARTKLESEDIEAYVADEHMMSINPMYDFALGGVRVQTKRSDAERALKILNDFSSNES